MLKRLEIDPEFKNLIPPLSPDEYKGLEKDLVDNGCKDRLVNIYNKKLSIGKLNEIL